MAAARLNGWTVMTSSCSSKAKTRSGKRSRASSIRSSQQRALELSAPTSTMTRTLLHIDAAVCSHRDGDSEEACRRTVATLTALPTVGRDDLPPIEGPGRPGRPR